ncbi:hypothetical protein X551_04709 [Methylibium sp. T29]|nr:hypothetical protein X551_04709 [Methylibium sp. T29]
MPVERHLDADVGTQAQQLALREPFAHLQLRHHADAPTQGGGPHIGLGRRHETLLQPRRAHPEGLGDPLRLRVVLAVEHQERHAREVAAVQAGGRVAAQLTRHEAGAGHRDVAHHAERLDAAAAQRLRHGRHAAQHLALAQPLVGEVLVVDDQFQPEAVFQALLHQAVQRRQHPGGQAVGVDGDRQPGLRLHALAEFARDVGTHGLQLPRETQQHLARLGQPQRPGPHHQQLADLGLERPQPLRHRRLRDRQPLRGALEAAIVGQRRQAIERGGIEVLHVAVSVNRSVFLM